MRQDKGKSSGLVGKIAGVVIGGLTSLFAPSTSNAEIIDVNPTQSVATINSTIAGSEKGDTINFTKGKYDTGLDEHYHLMPDRDYTFNNTIMHGENITGGWMYEILEGGNINISGAQTIENINDGFWIGETVYNNINISEATFHVAEYGIVYDNVPHSSALTQAAVNVSSSVAEGGEKMIKFYSAQIVSNLTPYASARNNSVKDLSSFMMDVPTYYSTNPGWVMLGNNEIEKNVLINSLALSDPINYNRYSSPGDNANFIDVDSPFLKENYDADPNNDITQSNVKDSVGNFVTDDMRFVTGLIPGFDSPLVIRNEQGEMIGYIGAYAPIPEPATLGLIVLGGGLIVGSRILRRNGGGTKKLEEVIVN